jgi:hypothetical protein
MSRQIFHVTLPFTTSAKANLEKPVTAALEDFFEFADLSEYGLMEFRGFDVNSSGNPQKIVKYSPGLPEHANSKSGTPVCVCVEGGMGVRGFLSCQNPKRQNDILVMVQAGKPKRRKEGRVTAMAKDIISKATAVYGASKDILINVEQPPLPATSAAFLEIESAKVETETEMEMPAESTILEKIRQSEIDTKLVASGLPQHDLPSLRNFWSELIEGYLPLNVTEFPEKVTIPCTVITPVMYEWFSIENPRGGVASLYNARIAPFGKKSEEPIPVGEKYEPWVINVKLVIDFIGGVHKIPKKSRSLSSSSSALRRSSIGHDIHHVKRDLTELIPGEQADTAEGSPPTIGSLVSSELPGDLGMVNQSLPEVPKELPERTLEEIIQAFDENFNLEHQIEELGRDVEALEGERQRKETLLKETEESLARIKNELSEKVPLFEEVKGRYSQMVITGAEQQKFDDYLTRMEDIHKKFKK